RPCNGTPLLWPCMEASFIEEEVFSTEIGGHDDEELAQDEGNESSVKRISVEDAIHQGTVWKLVYKSRVNVQIL
ncbi:Hypothetical predicted protein, partial [Paramuricea clavata]